MNPVGYLETNVLYCGDNHPRLAQFPSECVDLIYLDPPFFSNRNYEVIWGDEAEVRSFEDRWEGGINVYIAWLHDRVMEMHRILKPTGSIYFHCDWHASHYIKAMLDDIFGANLSGNDRGFQNEIVWYYKGAGISPKRWGRRHDTIFFYTKGKTWTFNVDDVRDEYAESTKERFKHYIGNVRGSDDFGQQELNPKGKHPDDVWQIPILAPSARERLGYPTQKPESLLERIILAASNKNDIVLDPFCGCGTTVAVAERLRRQWVGIDISPTAVQLMKRRLVKQTGGAVDLKLVGMPVAETELRELKPFEFQNWVMQRLNGSASPKKSGDMGIDGFSFMYHDPIQVKQSDRVGRNVVDNFETAIERAGKKNGYIIAFSFTRGAVEEAARAKAKKGLHIHLVKVTDLIGEEDQPDLTAPSLSEMFPEEVRKPFLDLPLPSSRKGSIRTEQLIASDKGVPFKTT